VFLFTLIKSYCLGGWNKTIPKVMLIEREGDKPFFERSLVPCPHCGTLHNGLKWSFQNKTAFKNWYGFYCDNCGKIIPPQRNLTSLLILTITFPLWGWFRKSLKENWLKKQPERYKNLNLEFPKKKNTTKNWLKSGLFFGLFMFVFSIVVNPLISNVQITQKMILLNILIWTVGGLGFGYIMKIWMNKKGKKPITKNIVHLADSAKNQDNSNK